MESEKKNNRSLSTTVICACIILLIICSTAFIGMVTVNHFLNKINRVTDEIETVAPEDEDFEVDGLEDTVDVGSLELGEVAPLNDDALMNILLIGQDRRSGESGRTRSDTMILVSINQKTNEVSLVSFMRDLYVLIPGYTSNRMNAAYVFGGYDLLADVFLKNFGIHLDGFFEVDFNNFISVIDTLDGVDITLSAAEAKIVGRGATEGSNHLNGTQALAYARIRKLDSDFGRTGRQRTVLLAIFNKFKDSGMTEMMEILDTVLPLLTTNLTNVEIINYALKTIPTLTKIRVSTYNIPDKGTYADETVRGMMVLIPDLPAIRQLLETKYLPL